MNYIKEINSFYDWLELNSVSDSVITLWHAMMHINNKSGWKVEFTVAISTLQVKTSLSKSSIIRARNVLKQLGRLDFKERKGNQSCIYKVIAFHGDTQNETQPETQFVTQADTQAVTQADTINKLNYTKLNSSILLEKESKAKTFPVDQSEELFHNHEPVNPESEEKEKSSAKKEKYFNRADFKKRLLELEVLEKHADDWIEARKKKRASFTESVIDAVIRECEKHNYPFPEAIRHCAEKSWQGFKFNWLEKEENGKSNNFNTNKGAGSKTGNNNGSGFKASGKVSARTLLASRLNQNTSSNSESGNFTIDVEAIE